MAKFSPLMIAPPAIFAAFVLLAGVGMFRDDPNALPSTRLDQPAPPVVTTELPGKENFDDATLRNGELKIVNYWASWCAPCRVEHPTLLDLAERGLPMYGVNYKDKPQKALGFLEELGDPYRAVGADENGQMALDWGVYGIPETFIIDGDGTVLLRYAGPMTKRVMDKKIWPVLEAAGFPRKPQ
jgi:cytochrome c biogenesis protein CcmG, thiol:disulfide interchange protein DsbE